MNLGKEYCDLTSLLYSSRGISLPTIFSLLPGYLEESMVPGYLALRGGL